MLEKTLESKLDDYFDIVPKELFEEAQEQAFQEMDADECTEEQCIMMIREILQVENSFQMVLMEEEGDTQISLTWNDLDKKRVEEEYCEGCKTKQLRKMIEGLVEKLVGENKIEVKVEKPVVVVEKKQKGVLFNSKRNGQWGWFKDGDEKKDGKFLGEIENGIPNGQGTVTWTEHGKYVGEYKNGERNGQGTFTWNDGLKYVGKWKDGDQWNGTDYYKNGNVKGKYVNGKYAEQ